MFFCRRQNSHPAEYFRYSLYDIAMDRKSPLSPFRRLRDARFWPPTGSGGTSSALLQLIRSHPAGRVRWFESAPPTAPAETAVGNALGQLRWNPLPTRPSLTPKPRRLHRRHPSCGRQRRRTPMDIRLQAQDDREPRSLHARARHQPRQSQSSSANPPGGLRRRHLWQPPQRIPRRILGPRLGFLAISAGNGKLPRNPRWMPASAWSISALASYWLRPNRQANGQAPIAARTPAPWPACFRSSALALAARSGRACNG